MVNYDEKGNEHFKKDYGLSAQSLIVSEVKAGKELRWENLEKVWDLTYDKDKFIAYVEGRVQGVHEAASRGRDGGGYQASRRWQTRLPGSCTWHTGHRSPAKHLIVAYYLHGDTRCPSCIKIEKYADAAVHEQFARELANRQAGVAGGELRPAGEPALLGRLRAGSENGSAGGLVDGEQVRFKRLDGVWDLLR